MILSAVTHTLEIDLAGVITTNQLPVSVEYTDVTSTGFTPGHQDSASNSTTAVTILSAPGDGSTQRVVRHINVYNKDTASATVTIQFNNNSTLRELVVVALASGQSLTWSPEGGWNVFSAVSTAASDTVAGVIEIAIQSEMETATDTTRAVVPGRLRYHPGVCKAWGKSNGAGTSLLAGYNMDASTDTGTGQLTVNFTTDFSSVDYSVVCSVERSVTALTATGVEDNAIRNASQAAGSVQLESFDHTATTMVAQDPANYFWAAFGDNA